MSRLASRVARIALPIVVLGVGAGGAAALALSQPPPERQEAPPPGPIVETVAVQQRTERFVVDAKGTVTGARVVDVAPEVAGRVVDLHPSLAPGGVVRKGDVLFRVDPTDYRLSLRRSRAELAQARSQLEVEKARGRVAAREWEVYVGTEAGPATPADPPALTQRTPQREAAKKQLAAARARIDQQRVALARTSVEAPYDAFVESEQLEVGAYVSPQRTVLRLVGIEHFWVRTAVPLEELPYLDVPGVNAEEGAEADVRLAAGALHVERTGRVVRLLGSLDEASRLATVLVEVDDPYGREDDDGFPLLVGSFVDVSLRGNRKEELVRVPRSAFHGQDEVFVFDEGRLHIREVEVARKRDDVVLVREGLEPGERVVTTRLSQPVDGMPLRVAEDSGRPAEGDDAGAGSRDGQ